ncbi:MULTISPECIES: hypothetical protein [unclassified Streptomyces]|uniref:hypothetical protein n=1 Tax=unclassified Streptomyces TaxID=2593676 RepID=UPI00336A6D4D
MYFLTGYFQGVHGYHALTAGLACLVPMVAIAVGSQMAGRLATRYGIRAVLIAGLVAGAVGTVLVGVAGAGLDGQRGEALRAATTDGLRTAVFVAAAGIVVTALVALGLRRSATGRAAGAVVEPVTGAVAEPVAGCATEALDSRPAAAHV